MEQKNGRRPRREPAQVDEQYQNRKQHVVVSMPVHHQNQVSTLDFEWPEFTKERDRIHANTERNKDKPIPEIFGVKVAVNKVSSYDTLRELKVGDFIDVVVQNITDDNVVFETVTTKQIVQSSVNLKKYLKLRFMTPFEAKAVVTKADRETAYIDILKPIYEKWLTNTLEEPTNQRSMSDPKIVRVNNLQLTRGGFVGQAVIPAVSEYVGQDYTVDAFIPGSQIVLNIEDNFEKWNGQSVDTFVTNYMSKPGKKNEMSLVCSRKEVLKFIGDKNIMNMFNNYCEDNAVRKEQNNTVYDGVVTGIINSSKKCGVFVEVPVLSITGMVEMDADQLVNYKPQDKLKVKIGGFEENTYYDNISGQVRHDAPYEIENDVLKECNIKPILKLA